MLVGVFVFLNKLVFIRSYCSAQLLFFILLLFSNTGVYALTIDAGVSLGSIAFQVNDKNGQLLGELKEDLGENIYFATRFKQNDGLWDSNWGYFMELGFGSYNIHTQEVDKEIVNLGTDVNGKYAYLTWMLYYKHLLKHDAYMAYGLGLGLGYLHAEGDVKLTEVSGEPTINVDVSDVSGSTGFYMEYHRTKWFGRLVIYGPKFTEEPYEFGISEAKVIIGRRFSW